MIRLDRWCAEYRDHRLSSLIPSGINSGSYFTFDPKDRAVDRCFNRTLSLFALSLSTKTPRALANPRCEISKKFSAEYRTTCRLLE